MDPALWTPGDEPEITPVQDVRFRCAGRNAPVESRSDAQLQALLDHVGGDIETAVDALSMKPWPAWLHPLMR